MSHKHSQVSLEGNENGYRCEEDFWSENLPKLQRYCHFLARNKWDGEDIAQETYIKALKYGKHQGKMTTALLNKIAYHHWVDMLRKRKNETVEANLNLVHSGQTNQLNETRDSVELLLKNFTPNQAIIFLLKEGFQYQLKEIATILDSTETSVKANLYRAKKRLEKAKDEKPFDSVGSYWDEEERKQLSEIFYETLKNQDPAILIHSISSQTRKSNVPKLDTGKIRSKPNYTPSSTLCMAA
jgi:RNA polymerase sigma factor (sigma-70 family)